MSTFSPLTLLGALGVLSAAATSAAAAVDTSQWKCELCPFEKSGTSATVEIGAGAVTEDSLRFGSFTGLNEKGGFLVAGGELQHRGDNGFYGRLAASDLGLDSRALAAEVGTEGLYRVRFGYREIPHYPSEGASTPFVGSGTSRLSLAPGFVPAGDTASMGLGNFLEQVELGATRKRVDACVAWWLGPGWSTRLSLRRDTREGIQRTSGSFFSSASQLAAPIDHETDAFEVSASYSGRQLQASIAYQVSRFNNRNDALTWDNPFIAVVPGADRAQLALAPDNRFQQLVASAAYQISPRLRASGELAVGQMTQDAAYLEPTLNPTLAAGLPVLPALSLRGVADTLDLSLRLSATATERLRLNASFARNVRDNRTPSAEYPSIAADLFPGNPRTNQPFSFFQNRFKVDADYRGPGSLKAGVGLDVDVRERTRQEVVDTREATLWGRVSARAGEKVALALKLAHGQRDYSSYGTLTWVDPPENPLLRKFNLAERTRNAAGLRADFTLSETITAGIGLDVSDDDYDKSPVGLTAARSASVVADVAVAISDATRVHAFAQGERVRSQQAGTQSQLIPDWSAEITDRVEVLGVGIRHGGQSDKLQLGADLVGTRSRSQTTVDAGISASAFPDAKTAVDSLKVFATYRLNERVSLTGSYWLEHLSTKDWRLDGVLPATVPNLLAFGEQAPRYNVDVIRLALRYRF